MDQLQADGSQSQTVTVSLPCKAGLLGYHASHGTTDTQPSVTTQNPHHQSEALAFCLSETEQAHKGNKDRP